MVRPGPVSARQPARIGGVAVLTAVVLAAGTPTASAAPAGWARWTPLTGTSRELTATMSQRPAGFPTATIESSSVAGSGVGVQSGSSTFLSPPTPPTQSYGSSRNQPYLNLRPAGLNAAPPSVTTYTFERPTPERGWTFVLGDIDADQVSITATDADGEPVSTDQLGFRGVFNSCAAGVSPKPACAPPNNDGTDLPTWDADSATLRGNAGALDSAGASGWFEPRAALTSLTFRYQRRAGSPVYQTWFSSLQFDLAGVVNAPDDRAAGLLVELFDPAGAKVGETRTDAGGRYAFPGRAPYDGYLVRLTSPVDLTSDRPLTRRVDLSTADQPAVGFTLRALEPVPVSGTVRAADGGAVAGLTVTLTDPGGGSRTTSTLADGSYTFPDVPAGADYRIAVVAPDGATVTPAQRTVSIPTGSEAPVTGQDFTLGPAAVTTSSVSGTVSDTGGDPVPGAEVSLQGPDGEDPVTAVSDDDGDYSLDEIAPGRYTATVDPPPGYSAVPPRVVVVTDADVTGVDFVLVPTGPSPEPSATPTASPSASPSVATPTPVVSSTAVVSPPATSSSDVTDPRSTLAATGGPVVLVALLGLLGAALGAGLLAREHRRSGRR